MPTPAAREKSYRHLLIGALVLATLLTLQLVVSPEIGASLTSFTFILCGVAVLVLAWPELERDVIQFGIMGMVLGGVCGAAQITGNGWWHDALFGLPVGMLMGDEVQASRKWFKLSKQTRNEDRWWQRPPAQSLWLPRVVWSACGLTLLGAIFLIVLCDLRSSHVVADMFTMIRQAREETSLWRMLSNCWYAIIPLAMSIALSRFATRVPNNALLVDGLLRRVAILQAAALLMLAGGIAKDWIGDWIVSADTGLPTHYKIFAEIFAAQFLKMLPPILLLMLAQIFLGRRIIHYYTRSGWLMALGLFALASVFIMSFLLVYAFGIA